MWPPTCGQSTDVALAQKRLPGPALVHTAPTQFTPVTVHIVFCMVITLKETKSICSIVAGCKMSAGVKLGENLGQKYRSSVIMFDIIILVGIL